MTLPIRTCRGAADCTKSPSFGFFKPGMKPRAEEDYIWFCRKHLPEQNPFLLTVEPKPETKERPKPPQGSFL